MPWIVSVCKTCDAIADVAPHGNEDELCEAPDGFEWTHLYAAPEIRRRLADPPEVSLDQAVAASLRGVWLSPVTREVAVRDERNRRAVRRALEVAGGWFEG